MNIFQLVLKQMRQRSLSTWLTLLSVLLGVALATAIMILRREGQNLFAQTDFGYDILIGPPKGSPLQLTLNTVYHMDVSPGVIPHAIYADMSRKLPPLPGHPDYRPYVRIAVPFMVGDSFMGRRIVGTSPQMFGYDDNGKPVEGTKFQYRKDRSYEFAQGRVFAPRKFEAVIGSDVADSLHLHLYDPKLSEDENEKRGGAFRATHGMPAANETPDIHKPRWHIVGILKPTHTANDRVLFIPYISLYAIAEHDEGVLSQALLRANVDPSKVPPNQIDGVLRKLNIDPKNISVQMLKKVGFKVGLTTPVAAPSAGGDLMHDAAPAPPAPATQASTQKDEEEPEAYHFDAQGNIIPDLPEDQWEISAILVQSRGYPTSGFQAQRIIYNFKVIDDRATAVNPASVMRQFFQTFLAPSTQILQIICAFVIIVAAASIMTTIYNSVTGRLRDIAILRALGATRIRILSLICLEAVLIGLVGSLLGILVGHGISAIGSSYMERTMGEGINWFRVGPEEWVYLIAVVWLVFFAGLVPALKAYRTPVASNLVAS